MIINGQRYEAEPAVEAYIKDMQAENEEQRREIINRDTDLQQHEDENMQLWYDNNKLKTENARLEQNNKDLQAEIVKVWAKVDELKAENARLEELYQKSVGVIAATDCVECKDKAVRHGRWITDGSKIYLRHI